MGKLKKKKKQEVSGQARQKEVIHYLQHQQHIYIDDYWELGKGWHCGKEQ